MGKLLRWAEEIEVKKTSSGLAKNARYTRYKDTNHREHEVKCEIGGSPALDTRLGTDKDMMQNLIQPQGTKKGGLSDSVSSAPSVSSKNSNILEKIKLLLPSLSKEEINYYYELFEERAAILEYDADYRRGRAEECAMNEIVGLCEARRQGKEFVSQDIEIYNEDEKATTAPYWKKIKEVKGMNVKSDNCVEIKKLTDRPDK